MADEIRPTPRSPILGLFSDLVNLPLQYMSAPQRTQQMQGVAEFIRGTGVPSTLERLSYGQGLFTGAGGLGGTTRLRPEVAEAALTVAPMVGPGARVAGRGAMAAGRAGERYAERVVPQIMERGGLPAEMMAAMGQGTQSPLTAYHGSPYRFSRFDPTKIGSGQGAQAYGYGHYLSEGQNVGNRFAEMSRIKALQGLDEFNKLPSEVKVKVLRAFQQDSDKGREVALQRVAQQHPEASAISPNIGKNLYAVDLPDEVIGRMLNWDKPLMQQSKEIQALAKQYGLTDPDHMGGDLVAAMGAKRAAGAEAMRQQGIPGIRYLDEQNQGAGTSNFVIFPGEEDLLRILSVNDEILSNPIMYRDPFGSTAR